MAGVSPLHILLTVMRERWAKQEIEGALALAKVAAPYMHGRALASRGWRDISEVPDDELEGWEDPGGEDSSR